LLPKPARPRAVTRFLGRFALYLVTGVLGFGLVNAWFERTIPEFQRRHYQYLEDAKEPPKILILGSSKGSAGIHPKLLEDLGAPVYNLSMGGNSFIFNQRLY